MIGQEQAQKPAQNRPMDFGAVGNLDAPRRPEKTRVHHVNSQGHGETDDDENECELEKEFIKRKRENVKTDVLAVNGVLSPEGLAQKKFKGGLPLVRRPAGHEECE